MRERFGRPCCRETIRAALHRLGLSWKKAKKLLGRADPARRRGFIARLRPLLEGARHDRHRLVYLDEAHVHQDADLGHGWGVRGERFHVTSSSPELSARVSDTGGEFGSLAELAALGGLQPGVRPMSLRPQQPIPSVPDDTARIARAAFGTRNPYLILRDRLGTLFTDADFADPYPKRGQPAYATRRGGSRW